MPAPANDAHPFSLATTCCSICGTAGVTILATRGSGERTQQRFYCGFACANTTGWPWLSKPPTDGQHDLFTVQP